MPIPTSPLIEVKQTPNKGRGVFATGLIPAGSVIERAPVLVMPAEDVLSGVTGELLQHYVFEWGRGTVALALGFGSMYNHSYSPNARYDDVGRLTKVYTALRDIQQGEEITINYNGHQDDDSPVGFEVLDKAAFRPRLAEAESDLQREKGGGRRVPAPTSA